MIARRWLGLALLALLGLGGPRMQALWSADGDAPRPRMLRHVVLFKFQEGTTPEQITRIEAEFRALPGKIDAIRDFEWGTDVSVEQLSKGFTHCFLVTFADEQGRATYLPHPEHEKFVALIKPLLADVCVVDYWSSR